MWRLVFGRIDRVTATFQLACQHLTRCGHKLLTAADPPYRGADRRSPRQMSESVFSSRESLTHEKIPFSSQPVKRRRNDGRVHVPGLASRTAAGSFRQVSVPMITGRVGSIRRLTSSALPSPTGGRRWVCSGRRYPLHRPATTAGSEHNRRSSLYSYAAPEPAAARVLAAG